MAINLYKNNEKTDSPYKVGNDVANMPKYRGPYQMSGLETFWYYASVILSFGFWFTVKVVYKKAMSER